MNSDEIELCNALESNTAKIGPIELVTKCRGKSKKGISVCPVPLDKVALGEVLHVVRNCVPVSAHAISCVVSCCIRVAAAHIVLYVVGYCMIVTIHAMLHAILGMLSQFGSPIRDAAAAAMAAPPKFPEAKSRGLVDLLLLYSFPKGELKRFFVPFGLC